MGLLQPRGNVPVDVAHVVVVLVFTQVCQIHARAAQQRAVVALQQAVKAAQYCPLQAAQKLLRAFSLFRLQAAHGPEVLQVAEFSP